MRQFVLHKFTRAANAHLVDSSEKECFQAVFDNVERCCSSPDCLPAMQYWSVFKMPNMSLNVILFNNTLQVMIDLFPVVWWLSRCFAALGDVSKARYLHETNRLAEEAAKTMVNRLFHSVVNQTCCEDKGLAVCYSAFIWLMTVIDLQSQKWLTWANGSLLSALCYHPLLMLTDSWTCCAVSRFTSVSAQWFFNAFRF